MIIPEPSVMGGIAAVVNGYRKSTSEDEFDIYYVESYKDGNKWAKLWKAFFSYLKFIYLLLFKKPNLVHIHSSFGASFYRKLPFIYIASSKKIPIINHIHGADFDNFYINASQTKKSFIQKTYSKCSMLIALSEEWKEHLKLIVPEEKITIIYNYSLLKKESLIARRDRSLNYQVLFLGEIGQRKGCYDFPAVIEKVASVIPGVKFVLAGAGEIKTLQELLEKKGVKHYVTFPGWIRGDEKHRLLIESDIFFLPSYNEGMPMAILDAMGYGLPIISTNVGGISKIVRNDENGYLCTPGDTVLFAQYIIDLLLNEEKLKSLGEGSYKIVENKYSFQHHLKTLKKLYANFLR